jgi:hypothetical protein
MGVFAGPEISNDGLVLALDAGNSKGFDAYENLMTNSQLGTTLLNDGGGVTLTTDTSIINPFGAYDGVLKCVHTTQTPGYFRRGQNMSLTAGVTYTFSFFFKNGTVVSPYGQNRLNIGLLASTYSPTFDETGQGLNQNTPVGDGWYRQVFTFTSSYTQTYQVDFNQTVNQTPIGTYYLYGFQLEIGSTASTYYPTTASTKTRGSTLIDISGRGNTGTLTNGPTYSSANGGSIVFDGTNDYVTCGNILNFTTENFSFNIFFYLTSTTTNSVGQGPILFYKGAFNSNGYYIQLTQNNPSQAAFITNQSGVNQMTISSLSIVVGAWNNIFVTRSGSSVKIYINGVDATSSAATHINPASSTDNFQLAAYSTGIFANTRIASFQAYNRALTAAEVSQNFNALRGRFGI